MSDISPPWKMGDAEMSDATYDALVPLDGYPKGSRGGPRIYAYDRWWVVVSLSDFGDLLVGQWGDLNLDAKSEITRVRELEAEVARLRYQLVEVSSLAQRSILSSSSREGFILKGGKQPPNPPPPPQALSSPPPSPPGSGQ